MLVGNKIREARKEKNLSQDQLAKMLFISSQAVGKWERGESMPDIITFNRLAKILGVDLNYFSDSVQPVDTDTPSVMSSVKQSAELPSGTQKKLGWNMSKWNWVNADFSGLKNLSAQFSSSNMQRCLFISSDMSELILKSNNVEGCDFSGSDISNSQIQNSYMNNNLFKGCCLNKTEFSRSNIENCDFSGANFIGAAVNLSVFSNNTIVDAVWNRSSFNAAQLADIVFDGTLQDCSFENCAFDRVTFQNATFINTFFKNRSLKQVKFIDCKADKMTYEFLKVGKADLSGITLVDSIFINAGVRRHL
jgi:uncharacterized protein YjbI with pentapeptide repeats